MTLRLTPSGSLQWSLLEKTSKHLLLQKHFENNWTQALFYLAAEKINYKKFSVLHYWQGFSGKFLTKLCHIPESETFLRLEHLSTAELSDFFFNAPPMEGGEYLSLEVLQNIWDALNNWILQKIFKSNEKKLHSFLEKNAPKWQQVGRVFFHLAENKQNETHPFAFMATYTSGLNPSGQLKHLPLNKALQQYAGENNRTTLIKLLSPINKASNSCKWLKELVDSQKIYQPTAWQAKNAYQFLCSVPSLEENGLFIRLPNWWKKRSRPKVEINIGKQHKSLLGAQAMLDFDVKLALGDHELSKEEIAALLQGEDGLVFFKGQWIEVDRQRLQEALNHWEQIKKKGHFGEISFTEGMRLLAGTSPDLNNQNVIEKERYWIHIQAGDSLRKTLSQLRSPKNIYLPNLELGLQGSLRKYQAEGVSWLHFLANLGLGACLADDMGLGKTIQILTLLLYSKSKSKSASSPPSLLIVPASLLANWKHEATRFAPSLNLLFIHPSQESRSTLNAIEKSPKEKLLNYDLIITTYSFLTREKWISSIRWQYVILDEAQAIKNSGTAQSKAVKKLSSSSRIALTGTPVENRLGDLWSLFDFLNPGLLGSSKIFKSFVKSLQNSETPNYAVLKNLISPYILRRMKTNKQIIQDLPDKTEIQAYCSLSQQQVSLYQQTVTEMQKHLENTNGIARKGVVLRSLMRLKQLCNHPSQLLGDGDYNPENSGKFLRLASLCEEISERQQKVLIFSQFREIIPSLFEYLSTIFKKEGLILHGSTPVKDRGELVSRFQNDENYPFFILSLKAGGSGLNLTTASHVIHFDRWWNPAVENQATDRAFRIGQKNNVLVHKFITQGTIEEKIDAIIAEKQTMADNLLSGNSEINLTELTDDELINLVQLEIKQADLQKV